MTARPNLTIVPAEPTPESLLRRLIPELDKARAEVARLEAMVGEQGRLHVRAQGEFLAPTVERLRREFNL